MASPGYTYIEGGTLENFFKKVTNFKFPAKLKLLKRKQTQKLSVIHQSFDI